MRKKEEETRFYFHRTLPCDNTDKQILVNPSELELESLYLLPEDGIESDRGS